MDSQTSDKSLHSSLDSCKSILLRIFCSYACKYVLFRFFCDPDDGSDSNINPAPCPLGYYCLNGTARSDAYPCPVGTYNPERYGSSRKDCFLCMGGHYCDTPGLKAPSGSCSAGNSISVTIWKKM